MARHQLNHLARLQQALTLGGLGCSLLWLGCFWLAGHPVVAWLGAAFVMFAYALVLAVEFVLLLAVHGDDPTPRARAGDLLRAWWGEVQAAPRVFCWRQPFRSRRWPDVLPHGALGRRGVLLVHGFVCNRGIWNSWLRRLSAAGVPTVAVNLEPVFGRIDDMAKPLEDAFRRLERSTGQAPVVVAHSMGGLVLRHWWLEHDGNSRVHHAITIATPHQGTWLARFGRAPSANQMRQGSPWLTALERHGQAAPASRFTCFYSHCDNIVFPASAATLAGADNRHLPGVAHVDMVEHPQPWLALQQCLADAPTAFPAKRRDQ